MGRVVKFKPTLVGSGAKITAARVLNGAKRAKLTERFVCGYEPDGQIYAASTEGPGDTVWLIEAAKLNLLTGGEH